MRPPRHAFATAVALVVFAFPFKGSAFDHSDGFSPYGSGYAPDTAPLDAETAITTQLAGLSLGAVGFHNHTAPASAHPRDFGRRDAKDFYLRVMPLGASITQGQASSDQNGYRKHLRDQLRYKGWKVNMVGSLQDGTMADSDHEGHRGWTIEQVTSAWVTSRWMKPNLVLVNVGLNDCLYNVDLSNAGNRMKQLIDQIFDYVPGVTVVLSTLLRSTNPDHDSCTASVNEQYRALFKTYKGARIALADVQSVMSLSDLGPDGDHPTDSGYEMFAGVWWDAISKIEDRIQAPVAVSGIDDSTASSPSQCKKVAGNAPPRVQTQLGSGHDDGNYLHNSINRGILKTANISKGQDPESITKDIPWHIFFANLVVGDVNAGRSQALDDWVRIWHTKEGRNVYYFRQNLGGGKFGDSVEFDVDMDCDDGPRYAFADFNNDGLDDFFCLKGTSVVLSLNRGGNPPTFENMGLVIGDLDGYAATDVRIADIDGDGRADFCLLAADGTIGCSRNGGTDDKPTWQGFSTPTGIRGKVFNEAQTDKAGIVLADLNGDFRSDYMYINDFGNVHTWVNNRGTGSGIVPKWRSAGLTHVGQTDTGIQGNVKFGRIYGSGRLDYVYLKEEEDRFDALVWENRGSGGTKLKADGDFYCDMRGSGSDDYVWIYSDGHAGELNVNIHKPPSWGHSTRIAISVPGPRVAIHLADWDGDGRCDIWVQQKSGLLSVHLNLYDSATDKITFGDAYPVNSNSIAPLCTEGWGVGIFDRGMRLADIDGDGRADILCIEKDGRITAVLNSNGGLLDAGQVKFSEGWDRANIRFADVEASGTADLIHLDKYTGAATVYKNNGIRDTSGSTFSWTNRGVLYNAIDRGENMY
ncbi:carbohydrate esterase family 3 protein [Xylariaceae sp. FL1019]|nr:carbohydrate esterase family 3 protein [Xylariaceae sp. FL1019]